MSKINSDDEVTDESSAATSASDEPSARSGGGSSSGSDDEDEELYRSNDAAMANIALGAGVHPAHLDEALTAIGKKYAALPGDELSEKTAAHHGEEFRRLLANERPEWHAHYSPPPATGPHEDHQGAPRPPPGKTWKPGKSNSASRADLKKAGINYR
jgi:hypothetical protein